MNRISRICEWFSISSFLRFWWRFLFLLWRWLITRLTYLWLVWWLVCCFSTAYCLHIVPLIQHLTSHLDILALVRHNYNMVHQQMAEFSWRHHWEQSAKSWTRLNDCSTEIKIASFKLEVFDFLSKTLYIWFCSPPKQLNNDPLQQLLNTLGWLFLLNFDDHLILEQKWIRTVCLIRCRQPRLYGWR
jgi:hypothetical protein